MLCISLCLLPFHTDQFTVSISSSKKLYKTRGVYKKYKDTARRITTDIFYRYIQYNCYNICFAMDNITIVDPVDFRKHRESPSLIVVNADDDSTDSDTPVSSAISKSTAINESG